MELEINLLTVIEPLLCYLEVDDILRLRCLSKSLENYFSSEDTISLLVQRFKIETEDILLDFEAFLEEYDDQFLTRRAFLTNSLEKVFVLAIENDNLEIFLFCYQQLDQDKLKFATINYCIHCESYNILDQFKGKGFTDNEYTIDQYIILLETIMETGSTELNEYMAKFFDCRFEFGYWTWVKIFSHAYYVGIKSGDMSLYEVSNYYVDEMPSLIVMALASSNLEFVKYVVELGDFDKNDETKLKMYGLFSLKAYDAKPTKEICDYLDTHYYSSRLFFKANESEEYLSYKITQLSPNRGKHPQYKLLKSLL